MKDLTLKELWVVFFKAALALGGGPGIMAALEEELVERRRAIPGSDFQALYALGRTVPAGTMTAVAIAYGHRCRGWIGSLVAVTALVLPSALLTVVLTAAYGLLPSPALRVHSAILLPGALALVLMSAVKLGKEEARTAPTLAITVGALAGSLAGVHPLCVLLCGMLAGLVALRGEAAPGRAPTRK